MQNKVASVRARVILGLVLATGMLGLLLLLLASSSQGAEAGQKPYPRLESALRELMITHQTAGAPAASELAVQRGMVLVDGLVRVIVVVDEKSDQADVARWVAGLGGRVETAYGPWTQALLPVEGLSALADTPGVRFVRQPWQPLPATTSEGVTVTGASDWHAASLLGTGIRVGVLDLGFQGYTDRIAEGELPADIVKRSFVGAGEEVDFWGRPPTQHGTACAEIVYDMAPGAKLYLVNAGTEVEWLNAVDWLLAQNVRVISFSAGWPLAGPGDGTGTLAAKVTAARAAGVLWINAAGNSAQQHWMGQWGDPEDDWWHNFTGTDETNEVVVSGETQLFVGLRWNDVWGASANDYDLFLFYEGEGGELTQIAVSDDVQDGDDNPRESITLYFPQSGVYHAAILKQPGALPRTLELFSYPQTWQYQTASSSLYIPADSPGSLTVGATYWQNDALESFSAQGPTRDGRIKPDLAAPDGVSVSSESWRYSGFYGTSASAPHVAGAAAVVRGIFPGFTPSQIQTWLEKRAIDLGTPGKDTVYGAGRLWMPIGISAVTPSWVMQGTTMVTLRISGDPILAGATFALKKNGYKTIKPTNVTWVSASQLNGMVNLSGAAVGPWTVVVSNTSAFTLSHPNGFLIATDWVFLPVTMKKGSP